MTEIELEDIQDVGLETGIKMLADPLMAELASDDEYDALNRVRALMDHLTDETARLRKRVEELEKVMKPVVDRMEKMVDEQYCDCPPEGHVCGWPEAKREVEQGRQALESDCEEVEDE